MKKIVVFIFTLLLISCSYDDNQMNNLETDIDSFVQEDQDIESDMDESFIEVDILDTFTYLNQWEKHYDAFAKYNEVINSKLFANDKFRELYEQVDKRTAILVFPFQNNIEEVNFNINNFSIEVIYMYYSGAWYEFDLDVNLSREKFKKIQESDFITTQSVYIGNLTLNPLEYNETYDNKFHPIIVSDIYIGGSDGEFFDFNSLQLPFEFNQDIYQNKVLMGGESVSIILDGKIVGEGKLSIPILETHNPEKGRQDVLRTSVETKYKFMDESFYTPYIAIHHDWDLNLTNPTIEDNSIYVDIDNDNMDEFFTLTENGLLYMDNNEPIKYFGKALDDFTGLFLDLNGDGNLEFIQIEILTYGGVVVDVVEFVGSDYKHVIDIHIFSME